MNYLKAFIGQFYRNDETICLACSPRSGSTWLAERLVEMGGLDWVDEPLRLRKGENDPLFTRGLRARTCLLDASEDRVALVRSVMTDVLKGQVGYLQVAPRLKRRLLLKFVRANRMLGWLSREFKLKHNVLMVRHPCAVVASNVSMHSGKSVWSGVTKAAPDVPECLRERVASLLNGDVHRALAINWALDQLVPLSIDPPSNTLLIFYEDLVAEPDRELMKIAQFCGLVFRKLEDRASATASPDFSRDSQTSKWKSQLSIAAIDDILKTCHQLGVDLYSSDPMPVKRRPRQLDGSKDC